MKERKGCGMGKLKEEFAEIIEHFDWKQFIIGFCVALAICTFALGTACAIAFKNLAWVTLWSIGIIAAAVVSGVEG